MADHIEKFGESLQHIGIDVENLDDSMKKFDEHGVKYAAYSEVEGIRREVLVGPSRLVRSRAPGHGMVGRV